MDGNSVFSKKQITHSHPVKNHTNKTNSTNQDFLNKITLFSKNDNFTKIRSNVNKTPKNSRPEKVNNFANEIIHSKHVLREKIKYQFLEALKAPSPTLQQQLTLLEGIKFCLNDTKLSYEFLKLLLDKLTSRHLENHFQFSENLLNEAASCKQLGILSSLLLIQLKGLRDKNSNLPDFHPIHDIVSILAILKDSGKHDKIESFHNVLRNVLLNSSREQDDVPGRGTLTPLEMKSRT